MRTEKYLNATEAEVSAKKFNIFLGLSLGNRYWTREHIKAFLLWALEYTKDKVAILIPDKIQAINYEVKNGYSPERAAAVAQRKGDGIEKMVRGILKETRIPTGKVDVVRWRQIEDEEYKRIHDVLRCEFTSNLRFKQAVIGVVRDVSHMQTHRLDDSQYARLAKYVIDEMPVLLNGFKVGGIHYDLLPYPGLAKIDCLRDDLLQGVSFPEITKRLHIQTKVGIVEAYAE